MTRLTRKFGPSDRGNPSDPEDRFLWVFSHNPLLYVSLTTSLLDLMGVSMAGIVCINAFVFFGSLIPADETPILFYDYECDLPDDLDKISWEFIFGELRCSCSYTGRNAIQRTRQQCRNHRLRTRRFVQRLCWRVETEYGFIKSGAWRVTMRIQLKIKEVSWYLIENFEQNSLAWDWTFKDPFERISTPTRQGSNKPRSLLTRIFQNMVFGDEMGVVPLKKVDENTGKTLYIYDPSHSLANKATVLGTVRNWVAPIICFPFRISFRLAKVSVRFGKAGVSKLPRIPKKSKSPETQRKPK